MSVADAIILAAIFLPGFVYAMSRALRGQDPD